MLQFAVDGEVLFDETAAAGEGVGGLLGAEALAAAAARAAGAVSSGSAMRARGSWAKYAPSYVLALATCETWAGSPRPWWAAAGTGIGAARVCVADVGGEELDIAPGCVRRRCKERRQHRQRIG